MTDPHDEMALDYERRDNSSRNGIRGVLIVAVALGSAVWILALIGVYLLFR